MIVKVERVSPVSGKTNTMEINCTEDQILRYNKGVEHIQEIFPELTPAEREFILTGITAEEWENLFSEEEK